MSEVYPDWFGYRHILESKVLTEDWFWGNDLEKLDKDRHEYIPKNTVIIFEEKDGHKNIFAPMAKNVQAGCMPKFGFKDGIPFRDFTRDEKIAIVERDLASIDKSIGILNEERKRILDTLFKEYDNKEES
jgi:hypothetical protein